MLLQVHGLCWNNKAVHLSVISVEVRVQAKSAMYAMYTSAMYATDGETDKQTDRRTDKSNAYCPLLYVRGHSKL